MQRGVAVIQENEASGVATAEWHRWGSSREFRQQQGDYSHGCASATGCASQLVLVQQELEDARSSLTAVMMRMREAQHALEVYRQQPLGVEW